MLREDIITMTLDRDLIICLYLKGYLTTKGFADYFYKNMEQFQDGPQDPVYEELLCTDLSDKSGCMSLRSFLERYILSDDPALYRMVSDAYIERLIETSEGELIDLLKQRYVPKEHVVIDCKSIRTEEEFIRQLKRGSGLSTATGLNWMAMDDLFYDAIFPEVLEMIDWDDLEERLPQCAERAKKFLCRVDGCGRQVIGVR